MLDTYKGVLTQHQMSTCKIQICWGTPGMCSGRMIADFGYVTMILPSSNSFSPLSCMHVTDSSASQPS